jgi:RNA polymerase sigma-70 factor (ECF subfamily)
VAIDGLPPNPGWIKTTARNRVTDRLRRERRERELLGEVAALGASPTDRRTEEEVACVQDDQLRLIFTCCHPALAADAHVALTLRLLGGLSTEEVARAFLVPRRRWRSDSFVPSTKSRPPGSRTAFLMTASCPAAFRRYWRSLYLVYNAGLNGRGESPLCTEATRLARLLGELMPDEAEVAGLIALLLLVEARRASRTAPDGSVVLLADQDRARWDRTLIDEGHAIVRACLHRNRRGPHEIQAAIQAVHTDPQPSRQSTGLRSSPCMTS